MAIIELTQGFFAEVDDEDFERLNKHTWHVLRAASNWYARAFIAGRAVYMHRFLAEPGPGQIVHHKNAISLDNHKSNLECTTFADNMAKRRWGNYAACSG